MTGASEQAGTLRILLTGSEGQLGRELAACLLPHGEVHARNRAQLDLLDIGALSRAIETLKPHIVINAAAYTAVDEAEKDAELAERINAIAPGAMAAAARRCDAVFVHYSTDYVFDGTSSTPYRETDVPSPLGVYGQSKLAGEEAVLSANPSSLILRTSWVYGLSGQNFLRRMQRLAREYGAVRVVNDQFGAPTWTRFIAVATSMVLARLPQAADERAAVGGIYHLASAGCVSWCEFAREILALSPGLEHTPVTGIASTEYPTTALRPKYSVLDCARIKQAFGIQIPAWRRALRAAMDHSANVS